MYRRYNSFHSFQIKTPPPAEDLTTADFSKPSKENSGANQTVGNSSHNNTKNIALKKDDNPTTSTLDKRALQPKQGQQAKAPNVSDGSRRGEEHVLKILNFFIHDMCLYLF